MADVESRIKRLEELEARRADIEAIKALKHRYFRYVDCKQWDELAECFTGDARSSYSGGKHSFEGRDAIMAFLKDGLGTNTRISMHQGHHPEIEITGDTTATGVWALQDVVIDRQFNVTIRGAAIYRDEYVKVDGEWKIKFTGYERLYEEMWNRAESQSLTITQSMFAMPEA